MWVDNGLDWVIKQANQSTCPCGGPAHFITAIHDNHVDVLCRSCYGDDMRRERSRREYSESSES